MMHPHTVSTLRDMLPDIARGLIAATEDISEPAAQAFSAHPDNPAEHSPRWHQYGILTHSQVFHKIIQSDLPVLMQQWGIRQAAEKALSETIQDVTKAELLEVASLVHDLGKFTTRTFERQEDGTLLARFAGHEVGSGVIVRRTIADTLRGLGLHDDQIGYIAQCAEHHFDLGKAREIAKDNGGYTLAYARSEIFRDVARGIIAAHPHLGLEIGLMFIADSLSKTEVMATADTDEAIAAQRPSLEQEIALKELDRRLINQALQQPVNVEIGKQYLQLWAASQAA